MGGPKIKAQTFVVDNNFGTVLERFQNELLQTDKRSQKLKPNQPTQGEHKFVQALSHGPEWQEGDLLEMWGDYVYRVISSRPKKKQSPLTLVVDNTRIEEVRQWV